VAASCCSKLQPSIDVEGDNDDQNAGIDIVRKALQAPIRQIADNAGVEGSIVVGKVLRTRPISHGYDAQNDEYVDMVKAGIIDPAKVVRTALQDAASVAGLMITTEAGSCRCSEEGRRGGGMPDMGGMGGMGGMLLSQSAHSLGTALRFRRAVFVLAIDDRNGTDTIFQESAPASRQQDRRRLRLEVTCLGAEYGGNP
jgi:hypothetical protein